MINKKTFAKSTAGVIYFILFKDNLQY